MSLIACTDPCVYQKDGYCALSRAVSIGAPGQHGCMNFVPVCRSHSQQSRQCLSNVGDADQLQSLRDG
jgi:hypothetical protein